MLLQVCAEESEKCQSKVNVVVVVAADGVCVCVPRGYRGTPIHQTPEAVFNRVIIVVV